MAGVAGAALTVMVKSRVKGVVAVAPLAMVAVTVTVPAAVVVSVLLAMFAPVVPASFNVHTMV